MTATVFKTLHRSTGRPALGFPANTMALAGAARGRPASRRCSQGWARGD